MRRNISIATVLLFVSQVAFSQSEFKKQWETKVDVKNEWNSCNSDLSMIIVGDLKEFSMVDGTSGKTLWTFKAKERLGIKSVEDWTFLWAKEGDPVEVVYKKPKEDSKTTIYLDSKTGEINSSITESTLKDKTTKTKRVRTRTTYATSAIDEASGTYIDLFYKDKFLKNASAGNEFELTVKASVGYNWSTTIKARAVAHLNRLLLSSDEPDVVMNIIVKNDKVFIIYEGISVLDLKTGAFLWSTSFDMVQAGLTSQEMGRSPLPTVDKDAVYICDFSKGEKAIKKLDINTGQVLWKGDKLDNDDVISQLYVVNNTLVAKFGGYVRKAKSIYNPNNGATTQKAKIEYEGTSDIRAYDIVSGKQLWTAAVVFGEDKISKSECGIYLDNDKLIACSSKNIYFIESASGKIINKTELGKEIGKPQYIFVDNNNYIVEGEEGIASFSESGTKNYATATGKTLLIEYKGEAFIVWSGKDEDDMNEFIRFDLASGKILGKLKGCYRPLFDTTGDYFIRFNNETITKYKTN
ncbi:MAG: PQQ-binding-like beta-propeller repeat protein [Bacteroidia bacterium]|nr:PQQ-binding-like beta-propeller repeat protein [Bacteroidia bacterium]